jgi:hypothetical protein
MVDYRVFGVGVLIQSGGKRLRAPGPQPLVEVPDIEFEVVFETGKFTGLSLARILRWRILCDVT